MKIITNGRHLKTFLKILEDLKKRNYLRLSYGVNILFMHLSLV